MAGKCKIITIINSSIKGYHVFKVTPHPAIKMFVTKEKDNKYDPHAMLVVMPDKEKIDPAYHHHISKEGSSGKSPQRVVDIA